MSEFKNSFSENIFKLKYAHRPDETWAERAETIVEHVCGTAGGTQPNIMSKEDQDQLTQYIKEFKFIPGGRYIYYAGRELKYFNNCLGGETNVLTDEGWKQLKENVGKTFNILSPVDGQYYPAEFKSHGKQKLNKITFATVIGHQKHTWEVRATRTHHWPLIDGSDTYDLRVGDVVPANSFTAEFDEVGFIHGFVFGDGNSTGQLRLCANKDKKYLDLLVKHGTVTYPPSANGDPVLYFKYDIKWKELPTTASPSYISSFILGWLAADGSETAGNKLCSINKPAIEWFRTYAAYAGITITGKLRSQVRDVVIGKYSYDNHEIYIQNYQYGKDFSGYKVILIEPGAEEEVFCPYEPVHNRIVIDGNIDTYQCFLLRAEQDTREEWADLAKRVTSCLMTGGGIGVDYSILRPSGSSLSRTGGVSSGPLSLMYMINEIGRNVMQGGSRRSAIYASLNWQHGDINRFLHAKNWHEMPVGKHRFTLKDIKQEDFNFPAPLDMTNISINYDNAWLRKNAVSVEVENDGTGYMLPTNNFTFSNTLDPIFIENCRQALSTGEPGFSFNFGHKENETLRNAPISGHTRVLTTKGYRTVFDIVDTEVTVWTGKQWAKTTFKLTKENVNTVEVFLSNGRSIVCDPDHPFIHWTKEGIKRTEAACLYTGDAILNTLPKEEYIKKSDENYGYGFVYGDGSIRNGRGEISYWHKSKQKCFEKACQQLQARIISIPNRAYFDSHYTIKEIIPVPGFIAGWFDADGSYSRNLLRLSCRDKDALYILQEIFDYWGINSIIREDGHSSYKPENKIYTLQVLKSSFSRFKELIPTIRLNIEVPSKVRQQNTLVIDVVDTGVKENVYCCDVGVEEHAFTAEGVLISNCTEVTSEDDSDVCNLGSINIGSISSIDEFCSVVNLASKFLVCGTIRADLPYRKVREVREKNRRLGLGLMGIHEWLLKRGHKYAVVPELHKWLQVYKSESEKAANEHCDRLYLSHPVAYRAIAPTGSIGILAATTTGIEPLFAVAYKRRYLTGDKTWKYEFVVDSVAQSLIEQYDIRPDKIDTALDLAEDYERRIKFQSDIQDYVDMSISSTINLPAWGTKGNNENKVIEFAKTLSRYAPRLRGFTCYPDGSRGGQPLTSVDYEEAMKHKGVVFQETDICELTGHGGSCSS